MKKNESIIIKGIALILMYTHHLFGFKERINFIFLSSFGNIVIENELAIFGKICVGIFLFLSGYGLPERQNFKDIMKRIFRIYKIIWGVFLIFIPLGIIIGKLKINSFEEFIMNLFLVRVDYNSSWWFALTYILLLISYLFFIKLLNKSYKVSFCYHIFLYLIYLFFLILMKVKKLNIDKIILDYLLWQLTFYLGIVTKKRNYFSKLDKIFKINKKKAIIVVTITILIRISFHRISILCKEMIGIGFDSILFDSILTFLLIYGLSRFIKEDIEKYYILKKIGEKSMLLWLIHEFYIRYYFSQYIYMPKYTVLILINLMITTYLSSLFLSKIYKLGENIYEYIICSSKISLWWSRKASDRTC